MNRVDAFSEINRLQDEYVNELVDLLGKPDYAMMKTVNFTSPTGTGKTRMMGKLINRFPNCFFIVTTLSKGQLHLQIRDELRKVCNSTNFYVYGSADYRINSRLDAEDIIGRIPDGMKCIWLRDEGHIATNRWDEILLEKCYRVINFSATNTHNDILCNFTQTMMLRTVCQSTGTPEDAIHKLLEIKEAHKEISNYNPCAIFRCVDNWKQTDEEIIKLCDEHNLKYINITDEKFVMSELCEDDNEYDVIINKFKIVEGIDIRRAHVLYMDNQPQNIATTIQAIGRCRRNALLYRDDVDIFAPENQELLRKTRECYVFYNVESMRIDSDESGELYIAFCNHISCESLKANTTISVIDGQLANGLYVIELEGKTGNYKVSVDKNTGFNIVEPLTDFYYTETETNTKYIYSFSSKISVQNIKRLPQYTVLHYFCHDSLKRFGWKKGEPYYQLFDRLCRSNYLVDKEKYDLSPLLIEFRIHKEKYTKNYLAERLTAMPNIAFLDEVNDKDFNILPKIKTERYVNDFIKINKSGKGLTQFCNTIQSIDGLTIQIGDSVTTLSSFFDEHSIFLIKYCLIECKKNYADNNRISYLLQNFICTVERLAPNDNINWHVVIYSVLNPEFSHQWEISDFYSDIELTCEREFNSKYIVDIQPVYDYFAQIEEFLSPTDDKCLYLSKKMIISSIMDQIDRTERNLTANRIDRFYVSYSSLYEPLSENERYLIRKGYIRTCYAIPKSQLESGYKSYTKISNDKESAIVGTDIMQQFRTKNHEIIWSESKSVTSKVGRHNKLNAYISKKYAKELAIAAPQYFNGKNAFNFDTKCNSMIGYCVEYYSKYLLYGDDYLGQNIQQAIGEFSAWEKIKNSHEYKSTEDLLNANGLMNNVIVRACMLKYKEMMVHSFGYGVARVISSIPTNTLISPRYKEFVDLIVELGTRTASYVRKELYLDTSPTNDIDPNLSIKHIAGLADYITEDTILDVKVRNNIDENCIRQVLAYHYLSLKRSDLHIKRVIVYDAVSNRAISICLSGC